MDDGVASAYEIGEIVLKQISLDQLDSGRETGRRIVARDRMDVVAIRNQPQDERAAEQARAAINPD